MPAMYLSVKGLQVWNSLRDGFKIVNTFAAFERKCKNLLFKKYLVVDHLFQTLYIVVL